jgi:hypothetical protein
MANGVSAPAAGTFKKVFWERKANELMIDPANTGSLSRLQLAHGPWVMRERRCYEGQARA